MARSRGSTLRMKQHRSGSVWYSGPGSVRGLSSTRLRPYRLANCSLNAYVSAKWKPVSRKITGTVRSMRLSRCASTTPPPPKLTVRAVFSGKVSTAHARVVSGSAPLRATARSRTCAPLSIARAPEVAELEEAIDHAGGAVGDLLALRVDHELRRQRLLVGIRHAGELEDLPGQRPAVQPLGVAADALVERGLHVHLDERADLLAHLVADRAVGRDRGCDHRHAVPREQLRDVTDAADVGVAVFAREPQALGEVLAHLVAVEDFDRDAATTQLCAHRGRERGLARAGQSGEPEREATRQGEALLDHLLRLSHPFSLRPSPSSPLSGTERGTGGEDTGGDSKKRARFRGKRARSASRVPFTS